MLEKLEGKFLTFCSKNLSSYGQNLSKDGFTLAEILIVIGIIGVIATFTIPELINNVQNKILADQFKTGYATLSAGFKKAMADDATDNFAYTTLFEHCNGALFPTYASDDWKNACVPYMSKYFINIKALSVPDMIAKGDDTNIITDTDKCNKLVGKTNKWWYLNDHTKCRGWKNIAFIFNNGMRADIDVGQGTCYGKTDTCYLGAVTLDVNGEKGPNTWGRDVFYLMLLPDGRLVGNGSKAWARWIVYYYYHKSGYFKFDYWGTSGYCSNTTTEEGIQCTGRLMDNNWTFDY